MSQLRDLYNHGVILFTPPVGGALVAQETNGHTLLELFNCGKDGYVIRRAGTFRKVNLLGVVYVAGPMRGLPHHNFPAFDEASAALRALGFFVFNPADFDRQMGLNEDTTDEDVTPQVLRDCLDRDLNAICRSTHIALIGGWEGSRGVRPEAVLAKTLGLKFLAIDPTGSVFDEVDGRAVCAVIGARMVGEYRDNSNN